MKALKIFMLGANTVIIEAFLRWVETAEATDRVKAAKTLARAFVWPGLSPSHRQGVELAMIYLLDDRSPDVRLALAEGLCDRANAPRVIMTSLAHDNPEIAFFIIKRSPVLTEHDLINLAAEGSDITRAFVAARPNIPVSVCAAIAEIGQEADTMLLLENDEARLTAATLMRIIERHGGCAEIRGLLWSRADLTYEARQMLTDQVGKAMASSSLIGNIIGSHGFERVRLEAGHTMILDLAASMPRPHLAAFVDHLRGQGKLTPGFLMQTLCAAKVDFFVAIMANLTGISDKRVASIIGDGRYHAMRALYEAAGLSRNISGAFVEATLTMRTLDNADGDGAPEAVYQQLSTQFGAFSSSHRAVDELLDLVDRLRLAQKRQHARTYAAVSALIAA